MAAITYEIQNKKVRKALPIRREPYFKTIEKGRAIGYRKTETVGCWIAKLTIDRKRFYHSLAADQDDHSAALKEAQAWFKQKISGSDAAYTLDHFLIDYVKHLKADNRAQSSVSLVEGIFRTIPDKLKKTRLSEITGVALQAWRDSFRIQTDDVEKDRKNKNTCNRKWSDLRAALNLAFRNNQVANDSPWRQIDPFKGAQKGRDIFFTDDELASIMTQAELVDPDFHKHLSGDEVYVHGKTGGRTMFLSAAAEKFFKECSEGKKPDDYLFDFRGKKWSSQHHAKLFQKITGLPEGSCFYCLRHYYISKALTTPDVTTEMTAKNVGTSIAMIEKFYGKFTAEHQREVARKIKINI